MTDTLHRSECRLKVMGGPATFVIDDMRGCTGDVPELFQQARSVLNSLEARYSRYRPSSLISQINKRAGTGIFTELDQETLALFKLAGELWQLSDGLFDITSGPLRQAWNFQDGGRAAPECIEHTLALVGWDQVDWDDESCHLSEKGMELDLGGLAKEYAVDCVVQLFKDAAVDSALIELAGDTAVIGTQGNGEPWKIGITNPNGSASLCTIDLKDGAMTTSGNYARKLSHNGCSYGHLLDPRSGWPVEGPASVTVIDDCCLTAGAISTVACLQSEAAATQWLEQSQLPWLMVSAQATISGPIAPC